VAFFFLRVGCPNLQTSVLLFFRSWQPCHITIHNVTRTFFPIGLIDSLPPVRGKGREDLLHSNRFPKEKEKKKTATQLLAIINNLWGLGDLLFFFWKFLKQKKCDNSCNFWVFNCPDLGKAY
jgi:hypothetical protein